LLIVNPLLPPPLPPSPWCRPLLRVELYTALYDLNAPGKLSFRKGDTLIVVGNEDRFTFIGHVQGQRQTGAFPATYVEKQQQQLNNPPASSSHLTQSNPKFTQPNNNGVPTVVRTATEPGGLTIVVGKASAAAAADPDVATKYAVYSLSESSDDVGGGEFPTFDEKREYSPPLSLPHPPHHYRTHLTAAVTTTHATAAMHRRRRHHHHLHLHHLYLHLSPSIAATAPLPPPSPPLSDDVAFVRAMRVVSHFNPISLTPTAVVVNPPTWHVLQLRTLSHAPAQPSNARRQKGVTTRDPSRCSLHPSWCDQSLSKDKKDSVVRPDPSAASSLRRATRRPV
jgi:hypothetical protein